ncbi:Transcriptional regulator, LysR family [hydrothermal vent metagenome]|uniref:Transcriptional regulator, LysR family n=1 Tax=hydrothermal vent metagenome TaxID=652676 RepID=A0A3B1C3R1_9ZZZZ
MDISSLRAFVCVAENSSFSRASEQLYLTQPAVSKRIATLESELDTTLFDRIGRNISLTESGQALLPRARRILLEIEDSRRTISNLSGQVGGRLSIATSHHIGLHRLPPVLRRYTSRYPQVELDLRFIASEDACRAIRQGELELGIITLPLESPTDLKTREVWDDHLAVVSSVSHPLAIKKSLSLAQLLKHPAILPNPGTYTRKIVERAVMQTVSVRMSTNYLETIKMLVSIGLGWSVLPENMLNAELKVLKVANMNISRKLGLVWHPERTLSNAAQAMMEML